MSCVTGYNDAFIIDTQTRNRILAKRRRKIVRRDYGKVVEFEDLLVDA